MAIVIGVDVGKGASGVMLTVWLPLAKLTETGITVCEPPVTWIVVPFTDSGSIGPANSTLILAFTGTLVD